MGDSIGRWEGETLVVETTNFTGKTQFRGSSENLKVTERSPARIPRRFTIGSRWKIRRPGTGRGREYPWLETPDQIFDTPVTRELRDRGRARGARASASGRREVNHVSVGRRSEAHAPRLCAGAGTRARSGWW